MKASASRSEKCAKTVSKDERVSQLDKKKVPELKKMLTDFPCLDDNEKKAVRNMKKLDLIKRIISLEQTARDCAKVNDMFAAAGTDAAP